MVQSHSALWGLMVQSHSALLHSMPIVATKEVLGTKKIKKYGGNKKEQSLFFGGKNLICGKKLFGANKNYGGNEKEQNLFCGGKTLIGVKKTI